LDNLAKATAFAKQCGCRRNRRAPKAQPAPDPPMAGAGLAGFLADL